MSARPNVFSIPPHRGFADALAVGLLTRHGRDPMRLARGAILLPNERAVRAVRDGFVRHSDGGLLLPRLVSIGDPALDDRLGALFDPLDEATLRPAIDPLRRQLILARLIADVRRQAGAPVDAGEAMRLAADLARTLDQLIVAEVPITRLGDVVPEALAVHWQASLALLDLILMQWPEALERLGMIDLAARRNALIDRAARGWAARPPATWIAAAGISAAGPAVARLLRCVARLPDGMVVLAGLDRAMVEEQWAALKPEEGRAIETHPQLALKRLLEAMGVARGEVRLWPRGGAGRTPAARSRAIGHAMAPAEFTDRWRDLPPRDRQLPGVRAAEFAAPAAEAQAIALALREAIEVPGVTAALVTPDRGLAARVSAHLRRWGIDADDSAGRPLSQLAPGTLLLAIADALAEDFAPVALLTLLKHPLVRAGEERGGWLEQVRTLDRALRGPRPAPGLAGIGHYLASGDGWQARDREKALPFWREEVLPLLTPLATQAESLPIGALFAQLREAATALAGDAAWSRTAGRAAAELVGALEESGGEGPAMLSRASLPAFLRAVLDAIAVRPPQGGHPRIFIWGLIEARLQRADLVIVGGLNEGIWPALPAPDPWLAPAIRAALGLPGLEERIGIQAQDFAAVLGAPKVLLTRSRRDARAPAIASRFWLRLEAMTGGLRRVRRFGRWAQAIDHGGVPAPAERPAPRPPIADRPRQIAVTKLDRLKADPFAFYADAMLKLKSWDAVDADPSPAWRGTAVHAILDAWYREDDCDPDRLRARAEALLRDVGAHPVLRALWAPRLLEAIDWIAAYSAERAAEGRKPIAAEVKGSIDLDGLRLFGTADRIDRWPDGRLAIIDYKTGKPPSTRAVEQGYSMQLGLLGLIAEMGGFAGIGGTPAEFEYWSLASGKDTLGYMASPNKIDKQGRGVPAEEFTARARRVLEEAARRWLTGDAPFTAKLHPELAPYGDYDQLMRLDEWYGRGTQSPLPHAGGVGGGASETRATSSNSPPLTPPASGRGI
ncbi:ATP-dependent helicase/nuclease subunit B [Sphingomonas vulcanisoli]|uniref:ATP-dependent helicase/nuclease subunit B n=1 Tax=Sphingomonas vulcanisoli TaxID=1658060 RepID=A0ABX0TRC2_9SPHN|nr:ATP-dependent helicase/nuclease subunit B [Sphingomonas vulcanisoli]